jgi:O-antigen/teichoic acid export membrane protein
MINRIKNWFFLFLKKTQKYTGTDNVYLVKGGFWLTFGQVASAGVAFLVALAFANLLDPATYGNYNYILSLVEMLGILTLSGVWQAVNQAVARGLEGSFYTGFKTKLRWGLLASLVALGAAIYYWLQGNQLLPIPLLIIAVFLPLMLASQLYSGFLLGRKLFNIQTKYNIITQIVCAAAIVVTMLFTKNLFWLIAIYFVSHTLSNYFFYRLTQKKFQPNREEDPKTISYGRHLSLMGIINIAASQLDKLLLFTLTGSVELAVYSLASAIPEQISGILNNVSNLAFPKLATKSPQELKTTLIKKVWKFFLIIIAIIIVYLLLAPFVYKIFFPQYLASIVYSQIAIFSLLALPTNLLNTAFQAQMMKKELYLLKLNGIIKLILLVVLVPIYGILGAVLAMTGAQILGAVLTLFLFYYSLRHA